MIKIVHFNHKIKNLYQDCYSIIIIFHHYFIIGQRGFYLRMNNISHK